MEAIAQLHSHYMLLALGVGDIQPCIDWAIQRLQLNQEGNDLEVVLLAAATTHEEALPLVTTVLERYAGLESIDNQLVAGKYIAGLRPLYLAGTESIKSLNAIFDKLYCNLDYPSWLVMLSRNCEYATDNDAFCQPFEEEFEYIAKLWNEASTRTEFEDKYSREVSNQHDAKYC
jgi:hypothetical protein